jgi:hypothetical protein
MKSRRARRTGHVACIEDRGEYRVFLGKPEGKRPLERPRYRWEKILKWIFEQWDGRGRELD